MKKLLSLLFCLFFLLPAARGEKLDTLPDLLLFTQEIMEREYVKNDLYTQRTYPRTANEQVTREMEALIDHLHEKALPFLPQKRTDLMPAYLDVGATVYRAGLKWMSFLSIARIAYEREQTYVDFDARVYDMETGERITLTNLFPEESEAWGVLENAVRTQLTAYFSDIAPDEEALNALCQRDALENAAFTLSPARLTLHFKADALYPGKTTLMHVHLYFSQIRPLMNDFGWQNTDCSMYKMIALTYDDGGARGASNNVVEQLRRFGANATFFVVGTTLKNNHDVISREHDAGYAVESHNYEHVYDNLTDKNIHSWKQRFDRELNAIIGTRATYMRAPGGQYKRYVDAKSGLPLIQWSVVSGDVNNSNYDSVAGTVLYHAQDGAVVLMHDLNPLSFKYTELILPELANRGYLCVTVDELFDHYGMPLQENTVYYSCEEAALANP